MKLENISLDKELLEKTASELAHKAAVDVLKDFYTGYNSPFKKQLEEDFKSKVTSFHFQLPDIIATLNEKIAVEVDKIANTAIARTYLPLATKMLTKVEPEIKLSEFLTDFIKTTSYEYDHDLDTDDFEFSTELKWPDSNVLKDYYLATIYFPKKTYEFSVKVKQDQENRKYMVIQDLPYKNDSSHQQMELSLANGSSLKMPFTKDVLRDPFIVELARYIMADAKIIFDVDGFSEEMFPDRNNCHC